MDFFPGIGEFSPLLILRNLAITAGFFVWLRWIRVDLRTAIMITVVAAFVVMLVACPITT